MISPPQRTLIEISNRACNVSWTLSPELLADKPKVKIRGRTNSGEAAMYPKGLGKSLFPARSSPKSMRHREVMCEYHLVFENRVQLSEETHQQLQFRE